MKTKLLVIFSIIVLQVIFLMSMGGFGPNSGKEKERVFSLGPISVYKYGMTLNVIDNLETVNFDGTPETQFTFMSLNMHTVKMIFYVDLIILFCAVMVLLTIKKVPGRLQSFFEILFEVFRSLLRDSLGKNGDRHFSTVLVLFLFVWISNIIGIVPFFTEPTKDINVPIGQMLVMIAIVHFEAIRIKGFKKYSKEYFEPFFVMFPLNVIGEMAKGISLSFRLFGNISGGAIIILVISYLFKYLVMPIFLQLFFGIIVGTIQAFVFTMLSITYISVATAEE